MRKQLLFGAIATLLFAACSDELHPFDNQANDGKSTPLNINVVATPTKTQISGTSLPDKSKLGVFVTKPDGSDYLPVNSYNNIKYTGTGESYATIWTVDSKTPVYLNTDKATAYAYYPYTTADICLTAIPITNDGTDWMYSAPVTNLNCQNATARFDLQHATSIIRIRIDRLSESDYGYVSSVALDGTGWATGATLNLKECKVGSFTGVGSQLVKNDVGDLSAAPLNIEHWVVPTGSSTDITFRVILDGKLYKSMLSDNTDALEVNAVAMTDWIDLSEVDVDSEYKTILTWDEARTIDGVYGMLADGNAMVYEEATTTSENLTGVAFVVNGKAYQVAKTDATGYNGSETVYWWYNGQNVNTLPAIGTVDGTEGRTSGYLVGSSTPQLSRNPSEWTSGALADFNGKQNTALIIAAQNNGNTDKTLGKAVMDFRNNSLYNEGQHDWFCPACGQLAFMYQKYTELNAILSKVSGLQFSKNILYWSSSKYSSARIWLVNFKPGYVGNNDMYYSNYVRLIREI